MVGNSAEYQRSDPANDPATDVDEPPPPVSNQLTLQLLFEYELQKTPSRTDRTRRVRRDSLSVLLTLSATSIDEKGRPDPRALWYAERMFYGAFNEKHLPDVRLTRWTCRLADSPILLSEYRVTIPPEMD